MASISFPIEVSPAPTAVIQYLPGTPIGIVVKDGGWEFLPSNAASEEEWIEAWEAACPGSASAPSATAGLLCVYASVEGGSKVTTAPAEAIESANSFGVTIPFKFASSDAYAKGSWAVSAE